MEGWRHGDERDGSLLGELGALDVTHVALLAHRAEAEAVAVAAAVRLPPLPRAAYAVAVDVSVLCWVAVRR